mmetsp:Transcript_22267/g.29820  ORF Transcript_22267/g.29820 Transcript_22267/m.29820 type:complete len:216 (+) Transcript_22267:1554-2201(+)
MGLVRRSTLRWDRPRRVSPPPMTRSARLHLLGFTLPPLLHALGLLHLLIVLDLFRSEVIKEDFVSVVGADLLQLFVDFALQRRTLVVDLAQRLRLFIALFLGGLQLRSRLARLVLDLRKELEKALRVFLKHFLRADQTHLAHLVEVCQAVDFLIFLFQQHLNEEHLSLFLNQVPAVFSVLGPFHGHVEACCLRHIDFVSDVWVDSERGRLDVRLA